MSNSQDNSTQLQQLIDRAHQGQPEDWNELLGVASSRLQRLTRRMLANYPHLRRWEQTDDIFQTAAIRLHKSLAEVKPDSLKGFFGLAGLQIRRTLIDLARRYYGPEGHGAHHHSDALGHGSDAPAAIAQRGEQRDNYEPVTLEEWSAFHESVAELPDEDREVFEMTWYGGLEQQAVADSLGISLSTVQRRIYRARNYLGQILRDRAGE